MLVPGPVRYCEDVYGAVGAGAAQQLGVGAEVDGVDERGLGAAAELGHHCSAASAALGALGAEDPDESALVRRRGQQGAGDVDGEAAEAGVVGGDDKGGNILVRLVRREVNHLDGAADAGRGGGGRALGVGGGCGGGGSGEGQDAVG